MGQTAKQKPYSSYMFRRISDNALISRLCSNVQYPTLKTPIDDCSTNITTGHFTLSQTSVQLRISRQFRTLRIASTLNAVTNAPIVVHTAVTNISGRVPVRMNANHATEIAMNDRLCMARAIFIPNYIFSKV